MRFTPKLRARWGVLLLGVVAAMLWAPQALAGGKDAVYVQTDTAPANYVLAFDRNADGTLGASTRYATGSAGKPAANPPLGIPFIDTAGSVTLSENGQFLFVVTNTIAAYAVNGDGTITPLGKTAPFEGSASGAAAW